MTPVQLPEVPAIGFLTIPDWAIAAAYRDAVKKLDPETARPGVLIFCADLTVAADRKAESKRSFQGDYALDPLNLAEWLRRHYRMEDMGEMAGRIPELLWIYEALHAYAVLLANPSETNSGR